MTAPAPRSAAPSSAELPIGLELAATARVLARSFDAALAEGGGSRSIWLILLALKTRPAANQRELAATVGIQDATLTHHLHGMEADGLVTRRRDPENRRVHLVELTAAGEDAFLRLREHAISHDDRLRRGLDPAELGLLRQLLGRLRENVGERGELGPFAGGARAHPGAHTARPARDTL